MDRNDFVKKVGSEFTYPNGNHAIKKAYQSAENMWDFVIGSGITLDRHSIHTEPHQITDAEAKGARHKVIESALPYTAIVAFFATERKGCMSLSIVRQEEHESMMSEIVIALYENPDLMNLFATAVRHVQVKSSSEFGF